MTNEEILQNAMLGWLNESKQDIIKIMDEARKDEAVEFALFLFDYKPNSETNGWTKYEFGVFMEFSTEELYQLFKNR